MTLTDAICKTHDKWQSASEAADHKSTRNEVRSYLCDWEESWLSTAKELRNLWNTNFSFLTNSRVFPNTFFFLTVHLSIFILVVNQLDAQNLLYNKFISWLYMFRASYAHRQEVKIVLYSLWYHYTYKYRLREDESPLVTCVLNRHLKRVTIPDSVLIQLSSWRWA